MSCCITPISLIQIQVGNAWFNHVPVCSASTQSLRKETTYIIWRTHWSVTGEKNECFGRRHTVISDKQKWFRMALFLYWGLPSPHQVGRDVVVLLLLLHCTASLVTPKHTRWCAEFTQLPCTGVTRLLVKWWSHRAQLCGFYCHPSWWSRGKTWRSSVVSVGQWVLVVSTS